jgi:hypothetical protein
VADDETYTINQDTTLNTATAMLPGVLVGDTDGDPLSVVAETKTSLAGGTVTVNADGSFTYTPPPRYAGTDSFTYTVTDGTGSANSTDTGLVSVVVNRVNLAPVAVEDHYTVAQNRQLSVIGAGFIANDFDPDGSFVAVVDVVAPANASTFAWLGGGSFFYVTQEGFTGDDSFTYVISDAFGKTSTGTVVITVTPPVL